MPSIEERLKLYIKDNYGSIRAFVMKNNLNYANVDSILRRGIKNATWNSVKLLCDALSISADELADEKIVPIKREDEEATKIEDLFAYVKQRLSTCKNPTLNNKPINADIIESMIDCLDLIVEIQKKKDEVK